MSYNMAETLLSQSSIRDPFETARNQYESKALPAGEVLSSSPFSAPASSEPPPSELPDFKPMLQKLGINPEGIQMTETGKIQLVGRLREKLGDGLSQNKEALDILELFNKHLGKDVEGAKNMMTQSLNGANRTLEALFGGSGV